MWRKPNDPAYSLINTEEEKSLIYFFEVSFVLLRFACVNALKEVFEVVSQHLVKAIQVVLVLFAQVSSVLDQEVQAVEVLQERSEMSWSPSLPQVFIKQWLLLLHRC